VIVMTSTEAVTGTFSDRFPFVRIGADSAPLVVLPGLALGNRPPGRLAVTAYARGFHRLARDRTLYVVQRPQGLPAGAGTADIAGEYAAVLGAELGRFDLMGLSTGGLIAQHLALDHPGSVTSMALVVSGARIAAPGREICRRWLELAAARRWRALHGDLAAVAVDGAVARGLARSILSLTSAAPSAVEAADFTTTVRAVLEHDTRSLLPRLGMPALVIGGATDPFFPADALAATAAAVPGAELRVFPRNGHGVPKHRAGAVQDAVAAFLTAQR
jgi:pimeloyl-ACP methyl ester carboxylesterase